MYAFQMGRPIQNNTYTVSSQPLLTERQHWLEDGLSNDKYSNAGHRKEFELEEKENLRVKEINNNCTEFVNDRHKEQVENSDMVGAHRDGHVNKLTIHKPKSARKIFAETSDYRLSVDKERNRLHNKQEKMTNKTSRPPRRVETKFTPFDQIKDHENKDKQLHGWNDPNKSRGTQKGLTSPPFRDRTRHSKEDHETSDICKSMGSHVNNEHMANFKATPERLKKTVHESSPHGIQNFYSKQADSPRMSSGIRTAEKVSKSASPHCQKLQNRQIENDLKPSPSRISQRKNLSMPQNIQETTDPEMFHADKVKANQDSFSEHFVESEVQKSESPRFRTPLHLRQAKERVVLSETADDSRQKYGLAPSIDESSMASTVNIDGPGKLTMKNLKKFDRVMNEHSLFVDVSMNSSTQQLTEESVDKVEKWLFKVVEPDQECESGYSRVENCSPKKSTKQSSHRTSALLPTKPMDEMQNSKNDNDREERHSENLYRNKHLLMNGGVEEAMHSKGDMLNIDRECNRVSHGEPFVDDRRSNMLPERHIHRSHEKADRGVHKYESAPINSSDVNNFDTVADEYNHAQAIREKHKLKHKSPRHGLVRDKGSYDSRQSTYMNGHQLDEHFSPGFGTEKVQLNEPIVNSRENIPRIDNVLDESGNVYVLENINGENRIRLKIRKHHSSQKKQNRLSAEQIANEMKSTERVEGARRRRRSREIKRHLSGSDIDVEGYVDYGRDRSGKESSMPAPAKTRKLHGSPYVQKQDGLAQRYRQSASYVDIGAPRSYITTDTYRELTREQLQRVRKYDEQKRPLKVRQEVESPYVTIEERYDDQDVEHAIRIVEKQDNSRHGRRLSFSPGQQDNFTHSSPRETDYYEIQDERDMSVDRSQNTRKHSQNRGGNVCHFEPTNGLKGDYSEQGIVRNKRQVDLNGQRSGYATDAVRPAFSSPNLARHKVVERKDEFSPCTSMSRLKLNTPKSRHAHQQQTHRVNEIQQYQSKTAQISHIDMEASGDQNQSYPYKDYYGEMTVERQRKDIKEFNRNVPSKSARNNVSKSVPRLREHPQHRQSLDFYDMSDIINRGNIHQLEKSLSESFHGKTDAQRQRHHDRTHSEYEGMNSFDTIRSEPRHSSGFLSLENLSQLPQQFRVQRQHGSGHRRSFSNENKDTHYGGRDECHLRYQSEMRNIDSGIMQESEDETSSNECMAELLPDMRHSAVNQAVHQHPSNICKDLFAAKRTNLSENRYPGQKSNGKSPNFKTVGSDNFKVPSVLPKSMSSSVASKRSLNTYNPRPGQYTKNTRSPSNSHYTTAQDRLKQELMYKSMTVKSRQQTPLDYCQSTPIRPGTKFSLDMSMSTIMGFQEPNSEIESNEEVILI